MSDARLQYPREALKAWLRSIPEAQNDEKNVRLLGKLIDTVFFASLEKEEGSATRVSVVYHEQGIEGLEQVLEHRFVGVGHRRMPAWQILPFEHGSGVTELNVKTLAKVAPAADLPRTAIVVGLSNGRLVIQGLARRVEHTHLPAEGETASIVLRSCRPGHVALWRHGVERFRYESGGAVDLSSKPSLFKILSEQESIIASALRRLCAGIVNGSPRPYLFHREHQYATVYRVVTGLVERMSAGNHGGLIAFLPESPEMDRQAALGKYRLPPAHRRALAAKTAELALRRAHLQDLCGRLDGSTAPITDDDRFERMVAEDDERRTEDALDALIDNIGQLSTVDNALLLGPNLEILCAGYPIKVSKAALAVYEAVTLEGKRGRRFPLRRHGSRHRAAATFATLFPGGIAFLCSQDGDLRCLLRPPGEEHVLLWNLSPSEW
ncbi:putative sensor domain DACNV-containing protein [Sorangium sp. So ce381]|uniref:putative sensor domain DACNV-containing protein n=1 Tax=Sorangium sp. So ce381 TaxID=3133307 RepID=UPI003F5C74CF